MKKIISAGVVAIGLLILAGIVSFYQYKKEGEPPATSHRQRNEVYHLRFGHNMPVDSSQHAAALKFANIVNHKSRGRVKVKVFPFQQLGTDHQMIEAARTGKLAIILPPAAKLSTLVPALQYADLPFLFPEREDAYELLNGKPGSMLLTQLSSCGLIGVAFWESGFKQFTANKAIRTPEDFMGLKFRVMKSRIIMDQFKALGAHPIPIDFHKTYQALKDGAVDGEENSLTAIVDMKFHEVQSHVVISDHAYLGHVFAFSKSIFEALPPDIRNILESTARDLTLFQRKETIEREKALINTIKNSGTRVHYLSETERQQFRTATAYLPEKHRNLIGTQIMDMTAQYIRRKYGSPDEDEIMIGLDADMTLGSAPSGLSIKRGMELAVGEINKAGGVLGKKIRIMVRDHGGINARGIANMQDFARMKNLVAVMGGLHSPVALSELDIIHREKIIYLCPWASATSIVDNGHAPNYVFRIAASDETAGPFLVQQALREHQRVALLLENTDWGRSNRKAMIRALEENESLPVAEEWFNWGEADMTSQLTRIENAGAEVILLVANAPEAVNVIHGMAQRPKNIPIIAHCGITGGYFWEQCNREMEAINLRFLQTFSFMPPENEKVQTIIRNYLEGYQIGHQNEIIAPAGTAQAYDLVHLLAKAIRRAGSLERSAIRNTLENIEVHEGLVKMYAPPFEPQRHDALNQNDFIMAEYDNQGRIVPIAESPRNDACVPSPSGQEFLIRGQQ